MEWYGNLEKPSPLDEAWIEQDKGAVAMRALVIYQSNDTQYVVQREDKRYKKFRHQLTKIPQTRPAIPKRTKPPCVNFWYRTKPHTLHAGLLQRVPHVRGPASIWKEIIWGPVTEPHRKKLQHHGHVPIATNRPSITPPTTSSSPTRTSRRTRPPAAPAGFPSSRMPSASSIAWETSPRRTGTKITKTSSQTSNTTEK